MYTRPILDPPESFVTNGKPVFGTFGGILKKLDIRGIKMPYGALPMPVFITNLRIKSRITSFFDIGDYNGCIEFFDAKICSFVEVIFWNKTTKQNYFYRSLLGPRKRLIPHRTDKASTSSYNRARYVRLSWDQSKDKFSVIFNLKGYSVKPTANAALTAHYSSPFKAELTCSRPSPTARRTCVDYYLSMPLHGTITLMDKYNKPKTMPDAEGSLLFDMNRSYTKFRSHGETLSFATVLKNQHISMRLVTTSHDAVDSEKYNGNVLFYNGKPTTLPPVVITHPFGIMDKWVIQDTENMVDLTFTPICSKSHKLSIFVMRTQYRYIYGTLEGVIMNSDGEKINIHSVSAIGKSYLLRL